MQLAQRPHLSRALALALLMAVLALVAYGVAYVLGQEHQKYDDLIASKLSLIAGYQRVIAAKTEVEAAARNVKKLNTAKYYLKNSSPSLAATEVQEAAQAVFGPNGIKTSSVSILPHKDADGRRKITVTFAFRATPEATQKSLYALEAALPYLFIDNLSLKSTVNSRRWQPTPNVEPEVQVQFELYGYAQVGKKK